MTSTIKRTTTLAWNTVNVGDPIIVRENSIEVPRTVAG